MGSRQLLQKRPDQFHTNDSRQYSMIIYLNSDWVHADGGQLAVYHEGGDAQQIDPGRGKTAFLKAVSWSMKCYSRSPG
ncbi:2OG-Fe(II) oxygenase [Chitinophaga sp. 22321]|uniref:2OG-Fe(II) oxygenase n=1 Tax=Chitinophaga sp. 22321 TaxID=3453909 RepID=UPI003F86F973